jgi:hypothetical protein
LGAISALGNHLSSWEAPQLLGTASAFVYRHRETKGHLRKKEMKEELISLEGNY